MPEELKTSLNKSIEILKEHQDAPIEDESTPAKESGIITAKNLSIYEDHSPGAKVIGGLVEGNQLNILETWTDGLSIWGKLGHGQWVPIRDKNETWVEVTGE
jgi:hypothetical protein